MDIEGNGQVGIKQVLQEVETALEETKIAAVGAMDESNKTI